MKMIFKDFGLQQLLFLGVFILGIISCSKSTTSLKPNIILILVDDLGWTDVGCYGNNYYETPNIDKLAHKGMKFSNGYASCAVCSPTRASVMTGRYPTRLGITDWIHHWYPIENGEQPSGFEKSADRKLQTPKNHLFLDHSEVTIAEILKEAGYITCHIGKWHLGQKKWYPESQGFDYNIGGFEMGHPPSYFDPYKNPSLEDRKEGEYLTDREADEAAAFIDEAVKQNKPFFLYMSHYTVHTPIQAKKDIIEYYRKKETPANTDFHPEYAAMVHSLDEAVGKIISNIEKLGITDNTVIFFTSDNGGLKLPQGKDGKYIWTDNTPLKAGKGFPYEGGIRVPFIVKWPEGIEPGSLSNEMVSSIDILPTICKIVGLTLPDERPIDGKDLIPVLRDQKVLERKTLYWHFPHYWGGGVPPYSAIRDGNFKLIRWYETQKTELYNLGEDISEKTDIADDFPEKVNILNEKLDSWLRDTGAKLPKINPEYITERTIKHIGIGRNIKVENTPSNKYSSGDKDILLNGILGSADFTDDWIGFEGDDLTATIDLDSIKSVNKIEINFLQSQKDWIFMPTEIIFSGSIDGKDFYKLETVINEIPTKNEGIIINKFSVEIPNEKLRFIRIHANNLGTCPVWHEGAGKDAWLFSDEIIIEGSN